MFPNRVVASNVSFFFFFFVLDYLTKGSLRVELSFA